MPSFLLNHSDALSLGRWGYSFLIPSLHPGSQLIRKDLDAGKDWGQEEKGATEDDIVEWHHRLNGHEFEQTPGDSEGQGSLLCCAPWGWKESDMTWQLNNNNHSVYTSPTGPLLHSWLSVFPCPFWDVNSFGAGLYIFVNLWICEYASMCARICLCVCLCACVCVCVRTCSLCAQPLNYVQLFATLWTIACRASLSVEFSRQECWSGLQFPTPGGIKVGFNKILSKEMERQTGTKVCSIL